MMKISSSALFTASLVILATACNMRPTSRATQTNLVNVPFVATNTPIQHIIEIPTLTPSPTLISTPLPTATTSITSTPDPLLTYHCVDISSTSSLDAGIVGSLVIENQSNVNDYILDLKTRSNHSIGDVSWILAVSPDRMKLAYIRDPPGQLVIADVINKSLISTPTAAIQLDPRWDKILGWLNNDQLLIERHQYIPGEEFFKLPSLMVYNPITRKKQEFLADNYPNFNDLDPIYLINWRSRFVPDPTLSRLVYPGKGEEEVPIILWDILENHEITRVYRLSDYGSPPVWLPDGSQFVIGAPIRFTGPYYGKYIDNLPNEPTVGGEDLLGVGRDGQVRRLTNLTNTIVAHPGAMSVSPDGRYVAYWLTIEYGTYAGERLAVADLLTRQVVNYCIPGFPNTFPHNKSGSPVWSPDGKSLAVSVPVPNPDPRIVYMNVVVLDLVKEVASQVAESAIVRGWMLPKP